jgi:hypothetical protein
MQPLIVETGEGLQNADAYVSITEAQQYFDNRSTHTLFTLWNSKTQDEKISAIRVATEYMDSRYSFYQSKKTTIQALELPRVGMETIPSNIKKATIELSARLLNGENLTSDYSKQSVISESEKYGDVSFEVQYSEPNGIQVAKQLTYIDSLMKDYAYSPNQAIKVMERL